jgi:hypothetical protein
MTTDNPLIRACLTCPCCLQRKEPGLVVCWPCHRAQKYHNAGGYSPRLERKLADLESFIQCETNHTRQGV